MREYFIFAYERRCRNLRHHESGVQPRAGREKRRQSFAECGIHQTFDAPFADARQRTESDGEEVEREGYRLAMKVSARDDFTSTRCGVALRVDGRGARPH